MDTGVVSSQQRNTQLEIENRELRKLVNLFKYRAEQQIEDLTGREFNGRRVIRRVIGLAGRRGSQRGTRWEAICPKGHISILTRAQLRRASCGFCDNERKRQPHEHYEDLTGRVFGFRTVLARATREQAGKAGSNVWQTRCKCGKISIVLGRRLLEGNSVGCRSCAAKGWSRNHDRMEAARKAAATRAKAPDSFGAKKREIQSLFWNEVQKGPAIIFVDGSVGEWKIMLEAGADPSVCAVLGFPTKHLHRFLEKCKHQSIVPPGIQRGMDIAGSCKWEGKTIAVTQWLKKSLGRVELGRRWLPGQPPIPDALFRVAHLDFCSSWGSAVGVIDAVAHGEVLEPGGILAITVSYRGDDWLNVWKTQQAHLASLGFATWRQPTPYRDSPTPMLFTSFQKTNGS